MILIGHGENSIFEIEQELIERKKERINGEKLNTKLNARIADLRFKERLREIFEEFSPDIVFHAAAHKHVPLMEDCPEEAIINNIFGTYYIVQASEEYEVEKFVLISTDKAVNPTSIMGASKRFCEMILQSRKENSKTDFVAVRFGNVLGSNGSVIPLFQKQIAVGGPVTITDHRVVRYFMTISEAVQLVLQVCSMTDSAEIYVLDMGQPVKIIDLAENLIRMSGYEPYTDIPIVETGLRPGEKLYEELLISEADLIATENQKIFMEAKEYITKKEIKKKLKTLSHVMKSKSIRNIKKAMKKVVPTYQDYKDMRILQVPCKLKKTI
jgi:FlaA1/EpsC-like NDP-sugar epimerase